MGVQSKPFAEICRNIAMQFYNENMLNFSAGKKIWDMFFSGSAALEMKKNSLHAEYLPANPDASILEPNEVCNN